MKSDLRSSDVSAGHLAHWDIQRRKPDAVTSHQSAQVSGVSTSVFSSKELSVTLQTATLVWPHSCCECSCEVRDVETNTTTPHTHTHTPTHTFTHTQACRLLIPAFPLHLI